MTLRRNRAARIHARRMGALKRLIGNVASGYRFSDKLGDCPHDDDSRARASNEIAALTERTARPPQIVLTRKSRNLVNWTAARAAHRAGKGI